MLAAPALLLAPSLAQAASPLIDRRVAVELADGEPARTVAYAAEVEGTLHVWALAPSRDLFLRVEDASGALLAEDDDSAGGTAPYLALAVVPGSALAVEVGAKAPAATGALELHLVCAPETAGTRAAAERARAERKRVEELRQAGRVEEARAVVRGLVAELCAVPGGEGSAEIARCFASAGNAAYDLGEPRAAAAAWGRLCAYRSLALPPAHADLRRVQGNLAALLVQLGDPGGARELVERALAAASDLPAEPVEIARLRYTLASALLASGDPAGARRAIEAVVTALAGTLAPGHADLLRSEQLLASVLKAQGELAPAREIEERVLAALTSGLAADSAQLLVARQNLATTLAAMGDLAAARPLFEQVLATALRTLPEAHPTLRDARTNLASALSGLGELEAARELQEQVLAAERSPEVRMSLATILNKLGRAEAARPLAEEALAELSRSLPAGHPAIARARGTLGAVLDRLGDPQAMEMHELCHAELSRTLPDDDHDLWQARRNLLWARAVRGDSAGATSLARELARDLASALGRTALSAAPREAEELAASRGTDASLLLTLAAGAEGFPRDAELNHEVFRLLETLRGAGLWGAALLAAAGGDAELEVLRERCRAASAEIARQVEIGADADAVAEARRAQEDGYRALLQHVAQGEALRSFQVEPAAASLAATLAPGEALVSFWTYTRLSGSAGPRMLAFVVAPDGMLTRVELGPLPPIEAAVARWRAAVGAREEPAARGRAVGEAVGSGSDERASGEALRALVLDPLRPALRGASRLTLALDGPLHLVPLDALPDTRGLVGEQLELRVRSSLRELLFPAREPARGETILFGGLDYGALPDSAVGAPGSSPPLAAARGTPHAILRAAQGRAFADLPGAREEIARIGALWLEASHEEPVSLVAAQGTSAALVALAPRARFLHLATHGWFTPASRDEEPDALDLTWRTPFEQRVRSMAPMALCGLALAGANLPPGALGRVEGAISAEELAALDLSRCELAVLSACDTGAGELRAGQGVASLQKALHMAGARSVVTSLWKAPDQATKELMADFYRRIWVEREPKARALWAAKMRLREARGADGEPLYATGDWAGWVLSGDPD